MKRLITLVGLALMSFSASSNAAHHGNAAAVAPPAAPVLQAVTVPFGLLTDVGNGGVRIGGRDNSSLPFSFYGIDIDTGVSGHTCSTWQAPVYVSGHGGGSDFTVNAANASNSTATTPVPAVSSGLTGNYVWTVQCKDSGGTLSNAVTLTYTGEVKTFTVGNEGFSAWPASTGSTTGYALHFAVGIDRTNIDTQIDGGSHFANPVDITWADAARPGGLSNIEWQHGGNIVAHDMRWTGNSDTLWHLGVGFDSAIYCAGATDMDFEHIDVAYTMPTGPTSIAHLHLAGCSNGKLMHSSCDWCDSGFAESEGVSDSWDVEDNEWKHWDNNCRFLYNISNLTMRRNICDAPVARDDQHLDYFQTADGGTPLNLAVIDDINMLADGTTQVQGPLFNGTPLADYVYIDDGTGSHGAGKIMTMVTGQSATSMKGPANSGSQIWGASGPATTDNAKFTVDGASPAPGVQVPLSLPSNVVIGSPGSPVKVQNYAFVNMHLQGISYSGYSSDGMANPSEYGTTYLKNFGYILFAPSWYGHTTMTATVTGGNTLTVTAIANSTYYAPVDTFMTVYYPGCANVSGCAVINSGGPGGTGTYGIQLIGGGSVPNQGPVTMTATWEPPCTNCGPGLADDNYDVPAMHGGTYTISNGFIEDKFSGGNQDRSTPPTGCENPTAGNPLCGSVGWPYPANLTQTNVIYGGASINGEAASSTIKAALYAHGDPTTIYASYTQAQYAAMTKAQKTQLDCWAQTPKTGGAFDLGGGLWGGPYGGGAQIGTWNSNGDTIPGCASGPP